jgi:hypothetical protein
MSRTPTMTQPAYMGDVLIDNLHSLNMQCRLTQAVGWIAEMLQSAMPSHAYQTTSKVGGSAIDSCTTSHEGYIDR